MVPRTTGITNLMIKAFINFFREARQRCRPSPFDDDGFLKSPAFLPELTGEEKSGRTSLRENPTPCGSVIRYVQDCVYEDVNGEFLFRASDVEQELKDTLRENSHLENGDEGAILNWIQGRDESLTEPTNVPSIWSRFQYAAEDLVRDGKAEIHCRKCGSIIEPEQIATNDDSGKRGWNFDRVVCPNGHNLLVVDSVHLVIR